MRILFGSAHPYLPQIFGGAQSSTHELVEQFRARGCEVAVLSGLTGKGWTGLRGRFLLKLGRRRFVRDQTLGYTVYRAWFPWEVVADVARSFGADLVMFQSGLPFRMAAAMEGAGIPVLVYLRNVEADDLGADFPQESNTAFVANSHFTARRFAERYGIAADVVYPLVVPARYRTETTQRNVTFINPDTRKGVDIALAVAELCPEIPFSFVRAWTLPRDAEERLQAQVAKLPNVSLRQATSDMRTIYRDARIVLVPSRWEEAFGRVAAEAHICGIPVVASDLGGLPEAVGPGGILISPDAPPSEWAAAIRKLWNDEDLYARYREAALRYSARKDLDSDQQISALLSIFARARRQCSPGHTRRS